MTQEEEKGQKELVPKMQTLANWILIIQGHSEMINGIGGFSPVTSVEEQGSLVIEAGGAFSSSEISAAKYLSNQGRNVLLRMPSGTRAGGATSDLLVDGINYDVYTPITNSVNGIVRQIRAKNSQTVGVIVDLSQTTVVPSQLNNVLTRVHGSGGTNIKYIVIMPK